MTEKEKIIALLKNKIVSCYAIEKMSDGRIAAANVRRYRKGLATDEPFDCKRATKVANMKDTTAQVFLEIVEEVERVKPTNKAEVRSMVHRYINKKKD